MTALFGMARDSGIFPGPPELRRAVGAVLGRGEFDLLEQRELNPPHGGVLRLRLRARGRILCVVVKRLRPSAARRSERVATRWLPALGLRDAAPTLLGVAVEPRARAFWHVYEDLGDNALDPSSATPERVGAVVGLVARVHLRSAGHPVLADCRRYGGGLGGEFYAASVRDALRCLAALPAVATASAKRQSELRDRLISRMASWQSDERDRTDAMAEFGGTETLLHGDLFTTNTFVVRDANGLRARLIDWERAAVGPACYDLSTFLMRFPPGQRIRILDAYRAAIAGAARLPHNNLLNRLFETCERARFANMIVWPALTLLERAEPWALDRLFWIDRWIAVMRPVLPEALPRMFLPRMAQ